MNYHRFSTRLISVEGGWRTGKRNGPGGPRTSHEPAGYPRQVQDASELLDGKVFEAPSDSNGSRIL